MTQTNDPHNRWYMLDANTGNWELTLKNVPGGTAVTDQDGSLLRYSYNAATGSFLAGTQANPYLHPAQQELVSSNGNPGRAPQLTPSTTHHGRNMVVQSARLEQLVWIVSWTRRYSSALRIHDERNRTNGPTGTQQSSSRRRLRAENNAFLRLAELWQSLPAYVGSSDTFFLAAAVRIDYHVAPYSPLPAKLTRRTTTLDTALRCCGTRPSRNHWAAT